MAQLSNLSGRLPRGDVGAVMVVGLAKTLLGVAVVAAVGYDAISVTTTQMQVYDHAQQCAQAAHEAYRAVGTPQAAYAAALRYAQANGETLVDAGFQTGPRHTVTVELRREAPTFITSHLPRVKDYTVADAVAQAGDPLG